MCLFEVHFVAADEDLADANLPFMWSLSEQEGFQGPLFVLVIAKISFTSHPPVFHTPIQGNEKHIRYSTSPAYTPVIC
jgi:hypothetical protein